MKPLIVCIALLIAFPVAASAHIHVRSTSPKKGAVVSVPPEKVRMTFSNSVEPAFSMVTVTDGSGRTVSEKTQFLEGNAVMETELQKNVAPGMYTVKWKCVSLDGHKQTGSYTFTVK